MIISEHELIGKRMVVINNNGKDLDNVVNRGNRGVITNIYKHDDNIKSPVIMVGVRFDGAKIGSRYWVEMENMELLYDN